MANGGLIALAALAGVGLLIATSGSAKASPAAPPGGIPKPPPPPPITGLPPIPGIPGIPPGTIPTSTIPGLPAGLPDNGIAGLPPTVQTMVQQAILFGSADDLEVVAKALDASGQHKAAVEVRAAEAAKRAAGGGGFIPTAPAPSDIHPAATAGFRSNPDTQWTYIVASGDSPTLISHKIIADERRYPELIAANPTKPTNGRPFPEYNFLSLLTGEQLLVPKGWNLYIDQAGNYNGTGLPLTVAPPEPAPVVHPPPFGSFHHTLTAADLALTVTGFASLAGYASPQEFVAANSTTLSESVITTFLARDNVYLDSSTGQFKQVFPWDAGTVVTTKTNLA